MIGRMAAQNPWLFRHADECFYRINGPHLTRRQIVMNYVDYVESGADIGTTSTGWVTSTPESISKKWTSIRDIIEWAQNSAMIYNITKEKFFENIEHPVQVLMD